MEGVGLFGNLYQLCSSLGYEIWLYLILRLLPLTMIMMMWICLVRRQKRKRRLLKNAQLPSKHLQRRKNVSFSSYWLINLFINNRLSCFVLNFSILHSEFPRISFSASKSSVLLDIKPWDDETDMQKLEEAVRSIKMEGLHWGACKSFLYALQL